MEEKSSSFDTIEVNFDSKEHNSIHRKFVVASNYTVTELVQHIFQQYKYNECNYSHHLISLSNIHNLEFYNCNFENTIFTNCSFKNVVFEYCNLKNVQFHNCTFLKDDKDNFTKFYSCNMHNVDFGKPFIENIIIRGHINNSNPISFRFLDVVFTIYKHKLFCYNHAVDLDYEFKFIPAELRKIFDTKPHLGVYKSTFEDLQTLQRIIKAVCCVY